MDERRERGLEVLERLFGGEPATTPVNADMMALSTAHLFGEVWTRPGLSLRNRELITVSVIAALGRDRQLRLHLTGALNAGLGRDELIETFIHLAYYAGYPAAFTALAIAREVFDAIDAAAGAGPTTTQEPHEAETWMKDLYTADVRVTHGRDGRAVSEDGLLALDLALPTSLGGTGAGTNPEQLFAAGFAACFASSIAHVARQQGVNAGDISIRSRVTLAVGEDGRYGLKAAMAVAMPGLGAGEREAVLAEAERICAYTNATRGNVALTITAVD